MSTKVISNYSKSGVRYEQVVHISPILNKAGNQVKNRKGIALFTSKTQHRPKQ